jgi:hypothetical protein
MALIDYAQGKVLDGYKDENLEKTYGPKRVQQLRRVPAEQRQNVMAEAHRRCFRTEYTYRSGMAESMSVPIEGMDFEEEIEKILTENGW